MIKKSEFETLIGNIKSKLNETDSALISEELLTTMASFNASVDEYEQLKEENDLLKKDKEELLKVNGRLYQKIGFDKPKEERNESKNDEDEIDINEIINKKGEFI